MSQGAIRPETSRDREERRILDADLATSPVKGEPKPILNPHRTQTMSTVANVAKVSIMLLIDHRFCITPP